MLFHLLTLDFKFGGKIWVMLWILKKIQYFQGPICNVFSMTFSFLVDITTKVRSVFSYMFFMLGLDRK